MHADGDGHDTAKSALKVASARLGLGWVVHLAPFHRAASVTPTPALLVNMPTASHLEDTGHETPSRKLFDDPDGLGVGWMTQARPFHCSAIFRPAPLKY
jgi:hypothetical protein